MELHAASTSKQQDRLLLQNWHYGQTKVGEGLILKLKFLSSNPNPTHGMTSQNFTFTSVSTFLLISTCTT